MRKSIHEPVYQNLIASLRAARINRGLRQEVVARRLGVGRTWIVKVEQCELRLDVLQLVRLARVYGLAAHGLVETVEKGLSDPDSPSLFRLAISAVCGAAVGRC